MEQEKEDVSRGIGYTEAPYSEVLANLEIESVIKCCLVMLLGLSSGGFYE